MEELKILITGGLGFIGSHTVVELLEAGHDCVIVDNLHNSDLTTKDKLELITNKQVKFIKVELLNISDIEKVFSDYYFDAVIHFAGVKSVGESLEDPLLYYNNNLISTLNLLNVMKNHKVNKLVFSSSATVYGDLTSPPISEGSPTSVLNPYGRTKLMIEEILHDLSKSDSLWKIAILRYFNPIGAHISGLIGERTIGIPNNIMPYINQVANGKKEKLFVFGNDYPTKDGTGVRDYIHVMDLANGHVKALNYLNMHSGTHLFNLGTGKGYSVLELISTFEKVNKIKIPYKIIDRRPGDIAVSYADSSKAKRELEWDVKRGLIEMCKDAWRWESRK